ncbi:MAG TPA: amidohydrolase [Steroidobacteraceae bacterium]|nr:amidohydrolase [Steroidobacteraceae bacterium]
MPRRASGAASACAALLALACAPAIGNAQANQPYPSTYKRPAGTPTLIRGATVLTGSGARLDEADVLIADGKIAAVGRDVPAPQNARVVDARGKWVTPGLIDVHSHLGVASAPYVEAHNDGNEMSNPLTSEVWVEHSLWPQDPGFETALEGGVTTLQVLPGSGNLAGGRSIVVRNVRAKTYQEMKFPDAPQGLKMACGENPKRSYGERGQSPGTRMANVALVRQAFLDAQDYQRSWAKYQRELAAYEHKQKTGSGARGKKRDAKDEDSEPPSPPKRDLEMETLVGVLDGTIRVQVHCYRADDMATMLDVADEFGFRIAAFHHGVEAYKIADLLARKGVCGALWADWWGFKMEAYDGIQENLALVDRPRDGCAIVHSDSAEGIQRLNQEAAKAMARGVRLGLDIPPERAIRWVTANPARALGLEDRIGTLAPGMIADVVVWNRNPLSVYALTEQVFIDGVPVFDRSQPPREPRSDFLLGQPGTGEAP